MVVDTACIVCEAVSMDLSGICLSVHPIMQPPHVTAAGMLLWAAGSYQSIAAQPVLSNKYKQCHTLTLSAPLKLRPYGAIQICLLLLLSADVGS